VAALLALVAIASLAVDALARSAIQVWGSEAAGAPVRVDSVDVTLLRPGLVLEGLVVGNPAGFSGDTSFAVGRLAIALGPLSVRGDGLVIRSVEADGLELRYGRSDAGSNFDAIESNLLAFLERRGLGSRPRMRIERLTARDAKATAPAVLGRASVPLRGLEFRDVGGRDAGVPPPRLVAALFDLMEPSLASALAHTDYGGLLRRGARGVKDAARKLKGLFD